MYITFENQYVAFVVIFTIFLLCCNSLNVCVCSLLTTLQPCVHSIADRVQDCLLSDCGKWVWVCVILYSLLQPAVFALAVPIATFLKETNWHATVLMADVRLSFSNTTNATLTLDESSEVVQVDVALLLLPYACAASLSTTLWLKLQHANVMEKNDVWEEVLFERSEMWAYESAFYLEVFLANAGALLLSLKVPQLAYVAYQSFAVASLNVFFSAAARFSNREAHGALMLAVAWGILGVVLTSICLQDIAWQAQRAAIVAVMWIIVTILYACMHVAAAGAWPADAVLQARTLLSVALSLAFLWFTLTPD